MKKVNIILLLLGLLLLLVPFFINVYTIIRLVSILIGIIVFSLGLIIYLPEKTLKIIFLPIILICLSYLLDFFVVNLFNSYPIWAVKYTSSENVQTYNSLFYRIYACNDKLTIDANYKENFLCNPNMIQKESVNKFLENPKESYKKTKNKFVHLEGKITTIVGASSITLSSYDEKTSLNGHVSFDTNKSVVIDNLDIIDKYYIYDLVEVIGQVSQIKIAEDKIEIHLVDAILIPSSIYDDYELIVNEINDNNIVKKEEKYYYLGIEGIYYRYDENNIYELPYLLLDKRESIDNLIENAQKSEEENTTFYKLLDFTVVKCPKDNIIFVNKNIIDLENICDINKN